MDVEDEIGGTRDTAAMIGSLDVDANRSSSGVLHRGALGRGDLAERLVFVIGESKGHRHVLMIPD